jgi:uncharacterized protein (TIGR02594 family)
VVAYLGDGTARAVELAKQYLGGNPTDHLTLWCADFVNFIEHKMGRPGTDSREAKSFLHYGHAVSDPKFGDIVVLNRSGGGHVGYFLAGASRGPLIISGNHGHRVGIGVYPASRVLA